ncbi:hypothetical protein SCP_0901410 [Sparassis crispa]|uniref:Uncharacterized protein n=1 Tax=Sparassis crispa TaxID=139825 RepID=A0A401GVQ3_9APHY|nr:hypothetical protein SCP_0901410 [Sparassis crispa]GBE86262.1 hypothetical protein SCP_0901410 [Sparassis crispa]
MEFISETVDIDCRTNLSTDQDGFSENHGPSQARWENGELRHPTPPPTSGCPSIAEALRRPAVIENQPVQGDQLLFEQNQLAVEENVYPIPQEHCAPTRGFNTNEGLTFQFRHNENMFFSAKDALSKNFAGLHRRDEIVINKDYGRESSKLTIRFLWPVSAKGQLYPEFKPQIEVGELVTVASLAYKIGQQLEKFIEENKHRPYDDVRWKVGGDDGLGVDDIALLGFRRVSKGSIQPELGLLLPRT